LLESAQRILDHGGGACGLGFGADVVDSDEELGAARGPYDVVFSSHTLEHCGNAPLLLQDVFPGLLAPGGAIITHVPHWSAPHWRAGTVRKNDALHGPHVWNFRVEPFHEYLEGCPPPDIRLKNGRRVGDNSILAIWRKPHA